MTSPLPSWQDTPTREAILAFVATVTDPKSDEFVEPADRIATFDNDGTLWCEQPVPQGIFVAQRLAEMAKEDASLRDTQPWKAVWENDWGWITNALISHYNGDDTDAYLLLDGILSGFENLTVQDYMSQASEFFSTALHPEYKQPFQELGYVPMIELLDYLRSHEFSCYIVSGGGRDFMRLISEDAYGIPPERVIGSSSNLAFEVSESGANVVRASGMGILDDGPEKPAQIWERVGRRPILAAGNANGDIPMLQYADGHSGSTLCLIVGHDDAVREVAYKDGAEVALSTATANSWTTISMKNDWARVFAFQ